MVIYHLKFFYRKGQYSKAICQSAGRNENDKIHVDIKRKEAENNSMS